VGGAVRPGVVGAVPRARRLGDVFAAASREEAEEREKGLSRSKVLSPAIANEDRVATTRIVSLADLEAEGGIELAKRVAYQAVGPLMMIGRIRLQERRPES
jgi:hypothetical protein